MKITSLFLLIGLVAPLASASEPSQVCSVSGALRATAYPLEQYKSLSACAKIQALWADVLTTNYLNTDSGLPPVPGISVGDVIHLMGPGLGQTFDHTSDFMPEGRKKRLHPMGSVAVVELVQTATNTHPYTGMFTGAWGLARLSLAASEEYLNGNFTPGMALKFPINGAEYASVNIQVMYSLDGQGTRNFFANTFSNIIPEPSDRAMQLLALRFEGVHSPATALPIDHLGAISQDGSEPTDSYSPTKLEFRPRYEAASVVGTEQDFRLDLAKLKSGTPIYDLTDGDGLLIGTLILRSELVASSFGDEKLFFQHHH